MSLSTAGQGHHGAFYPLIAPMLYFHQDSCPQPIPIAGTRPRDFNELAGRHINQQHLSAGTRPARLRYVVWFVALFEWYRNSQDRHRDQSGQSTGKSIGKWSVLLRQNPNSDCRKIVGNVDDHRGDSLVLDIGVDQCCNRFHASHEHREVGISVAVKKASLSPVGELKNGYPNPSVR